jgi:phospholipase C
MSKLRISVFAVVVLAVGGTLMSLNGCGSSIGGSPPPPPPGRIKHVVVIFQENRTPDNLFQDPVLISRGADIASSGKTSTGQIVQLQPAPLADAWDMGHNHQSFLKAWDNGAMDGFDRDDVFCPPGQPNCAPANPEYFFVQPSDVQPYFTMAETYTFGDRMFQTNQGPSFPAHQYIISGTSAIVAKSNFDAAENPHSSLAGCIAPPDAFVKIIDTTNPDPDTDETKTTFPCFEHPTLTDLLDAAQISWKYYTPTPWFDLDRAGRDQPHVRAQRLPAERHRLHRAGMDQPRRDRRTAEPNPERHRRRTTGDRQLGDSQ